MAKEAGDLGFLRIRHLSLWRDTAKTIPGCGWSPAQCPQSASCVPPQCWFSSWAPGTLCCRRASGWLSRVALSAWVTNELKTRLNCGARPCLKERKKVALCCPQFSCPACIAPESSRAACLGSPWSRCTLSRSRGQAAERLPSRQPRSEGTMGELCSQTARPYKSCPSRLPQQLKISPPAEQAWALAARMLFFQVGPP